MSIRTIQLGPQEKAKAPSPTCREAAVLTVGPAFWSPSKKSSSKKQKKRKKKPT